MKADVSTPTPPEDFSLVLGGPLYQMYLRWRLVRPPVDLSSGASSHSSS